MGDNVFNITFFMVLTFMCERQNIWTEKPTKTRHNFSIRYCTIFKKYVLFRENNQPRWRGGPSGTKERCDHAENREVERSTCARRTGLLIADEARQVESFNCAHPMPCIPLTLNSGDQHDEEYSTFQLTL